MHRFKRLFTRFKKNPNGETVHIDEDLKKPENAGLQVLSRRFRTAQILLFLALFLFVTVFALTNSDRITYQNLYYFIKDFRVAVDHTEAEGTAGFAYATETDPTFALFKGGVAVAGRERLQILTATGAISTTEVLQLADPGLSSSGNLLLVYAKGEHKCFLYNSFTKLHSEVLDGKIRTAMLSESGAFSVVTDDGSYASVVSVYNRNFRKINRYSLNSSVISAPLSDDGSTIAILSYVQSEGVFEARVRLAKTGTDTVYCDYTVADAFPLGIAFTNDRCALMLTDRGIHRITESGGTEIEAFETEISLFASDASGFALLFSDGSLKCYGKDGESLFTRSVQEPIRALTKFGDIVFLKTDRSILRYGKDVETPDAVACVGYDGVMLPYSVTSVLLSSNGEARYFRFLTD